VWSVGCIFAELMLRTPYLPGDSDVNQLQTIFRALGTPTEADWPGHTKLPDYVDVGQFPKLPLRDLFTAATADCLNLLARTLLYEPRRRISALDALHHPYFSALPNPSHPSKLPKTSEATTVDEEELEGKVHEDGHKGVKVKARPPLKRKASALITEEDQERSRGIARRLDFGNARSGSDVRSP
jgi:cyclin-dependent kinase 7